MSRKFKYSIPVLVLFASIFLFGGTAHAQEQPLSVKQEIIEQKEETVEQKFGILTTTDEELESLEEKKNKLLEVLEAETKTIEELKKKVEQKRARAEAERKRLEELKDMFVDVQHYAPNSAGNTYAPGNCTWYVKSVRPDIPNSFGNANTWYSRAAAQGWNVGLTPKKGAIATTTRGYWGHVAHVVGVSADGQLVTIREMNYLGLYLVGARTVHYSEFNYIYELG